MYEKVNPQHPDKQADRIAGAIVDLAYKKDDEPRIAVEVLVGHGNCFVILETSVKFMKKEIKDIITRITGEELKIKLVTVNQDPLLYKNRGFGDNGIFKGVPTNAEERKLSEIARKLYNKYRADGKYIIDDDKLIICQSNAEEDEIRSLVKEDAVINPLGYWTGSTEVDSGATNRKLGSDIGRAVTGGGLHGKDLSKADVSVNILCHVLANKKGKVIEASCAIGDDTINIDGEDYTYEDVIKIARYYINNIGGFEKLAEYGLI